MTSASWLKVWSALGSLVVLHSAVAGDACMRPISADFEKLAKGASRTAIEARATQLCQETSTSAEVVESSPGVLRSVACIGPEGPEGPSLRWHPNGKLATRGQMTSQSGSPQLCGKWQRYFESGELRDEGSWADGRPVGEWQVREDEGAELKPQVFDRAFVRTVEWSLLAGLNLLVDSDRNSNYAGVVPRRTAYPGPTISARAGYRLLSWFFLEGALGADLFLNRTEDYFGVRSNVTFAPFLTGNLYWTTYDGRWRFGLQAGIETAIAFDGSKSDSLIHPYGLLAAQFQLPGEPGQRRWFFEAATTPFFLGFPLMVHALAGLRW